MIGVSTTDGTTTDRDVHSSPDPPPYATHHPPLAPLHPDSSRSSYCSRARHPTMRLQDEDGQSSSCSRTAAAPTTASPSLPPQQQHRKRQLQTLDNHRTSQTDAIMGRCKPNYTGGVHRACATGRRSAECRTKALNKAKSNSSSVDESQRNYLTDG